MAISKARAMSLEVKKLIDMGTEKGFLTYEEIDTTLPPGTLASERVDDMMMLFEELGIQLVTKASQYKGAPKPEKPKPAPAPRKRAIKIDDSKASDPVRMYLSKMGEVALLTREGEVEIASLDDYTSHNTERLDVAGVKKLISSLDLVQDASHD